MLCLSAASECAWLPLLHLMVWMPELLSAADRTEQWLISHQCEARCQKWDAQPLLIGFKHNLEQGRLSTYTAAAPLFLFVCLFLIFYCRHCPAVLKLRLVKAVEGMAKPDYFCCWFIFACAAPVSYTSLYMLPWLFKCNYFKGWGRSTVFLHHRKLMWTLYHSKC